MVIFNSYVKLPEGISGRIRHDRASTHLDTDQFHEICEDFSDLRVRSTWKTILIGSMYAIYGDIYHQYTPNVSIYTIHGSYGIGRNHYASVPAPWKLRSPWLLRVGLVRVVAWLVINGLRSERVQAGMLRCGEFFCSGFFVDSLKGHPDHPVILEKVRLLHSMIFYRF